MGSERHCQRLRPAVEKVSLYSHLRDANDDNVKSICEDANCDIVKSICGDANCDNDFFTIDVTFCPLDLLLVRTGSENRSLTFKTNQKWTH